MTASATPYPRLCLDVNDRNELVMSQLPEVHFIARRIYRQLQAIVSLEDLIHSGVLGLLEATQKYDSTTNVKFKTFAQFRIRGAILDSLRELDRASRRLRCKSRKLKAASEKLSLRLGRRPTEEEIAFELGVDLVDLRKLATTLRSLESVDRRRASGNDRFETRDLIESAPAKADQNPFSHCVQSEMRQSLAQAIATLNPREQRVLSLYYFEQLMMQEIASLLGVKTSRISQIHCAAIAKLRAHLSAQQDGGNVKPGVAPRAVQSLEQTLRMNSRA